MLVKDLGQFSKHCWLRASRIYCNVLLSRQTSACQRSLEPLIFAYKFYYYKYTTLLAYHRPKLEKM